MVRTKEKPSHLNATQHRRVSWNLQNLPNSESGSSNHPGRSTEEAPLINLINDEEEEEEVEDEEEEEDFDYEPPSSYFQKKSIRVKDSPEGEEKPRPRKPKKKETKIDYGSFKGVLDKCDFCVKIYSNLVSSTNIHCLFGEISITLMDFSDHNLIIEDSFWIYVSKESNESAIYFEWHEVDVDNPGVSKAKKVKANKFKYFHVEELLDAEMWTGLNVQRYFQVVVDKFEGSKMLLKVYFLKSGLVSLNYPCEYNQGNKSLSAVCSYFYGIEPFEKTGEKVLKHDVDIFYKAIKNKHRGVDYCDADVQHDNLIPNLRPYQMQAVKWMLFQERKTNLTNEKKLHLLFLEIKSLDNIILYYNQFGRFFVSTKPLEVLPSPGGILADEMGLGKTVEVLACIMCNFRQEFKENSSFLSEKEEPEDIELVENKPFISDISEEDMLNEVGLKSDHETTDVSETLHTKENKWDEEESNGKRPKRRSCARINYSLLDNVLDSDKDDDDDYEPDVINEVDEKVEIDKGSKAIGVESRGRSKRKASQIDFSQIDSDEESYRRPISKRMKSKQTATPKTFDVEKEIAENSVLSSVERVILEKVWDGVLKEYKKEGSHKEFRKFLKMRKKDPYYLMTLRERLNVTYQNSITEYSAISAVNRSVCQGFFDTKVQQKSYFECVCGDEGTNNYDAMSRIQCTVCSLWQHADCVKFKLNNPNRGKYICPHCWTTQPAVVSGATLIVAPSSISHQWVEEIDKHIKEKSIKVFVYNGVASHGYIQPRSLASYDIVITTYETLRREVNYVDLPHSNSEAGRRFRFPKRFMATPSPLPCVEWWRVCLDEAQMVECTTTKTAEMALRLSAINRWCITGTPIQKTVNDLQGLLMFMGVDPYFVPQWWERCLYDPYCFGVTDPLHGVMAECMWRNSKSDVIHQLDIPSQSEEIHWLNFTPVEEHFYKRLHEDCSDDALRRIRKFPNRSTKLCSLDRHTLSSLLHPLLKLRQACNHPQVVKGHFVGLNRKTLTMEQLLENLLKKSQLEVEDCQRIIVASLNGLAALDIIRRDFVDAVDKYRQVLQSVEEHKENFKTDSLQQLHTLHNLSEIIEAKHEGVQPTLRDESLAQEAKNIRDRYLKLYPQRIAESELECDQNFGAVEEARSKFHSKMEWWILALESLDGEFVQEVREELLSQYTRFEERKCILYNTHSRAQLLQLVKAKMKSLECQRKSMVSSVRELLKEDPERVLNGAIDCHLRPSDTETPNCVLCVKHEFFEEYEQNLFFVKDKKHSRSTDRSKETKKVIDKLQMMEATRQGNWGQSEIERVLRYLQTKSLGRVEPRVYEDSQTHLSVIQAMKKEFKTFRILWRAIYDHVSALDEVNMATLRFRLRFPGEDLPPPRKKKEPSDDLEKKMDAPTYVLEELEIPQQEMKLKSEKLVSQNELRLKLGQYYYLKNLEKVDFGKGDTNPEPCPVCQGQLGHKWKVLLCGHSYCMDCLAMLVKRVPICSMNGAVKCPMCRQPTKIREIAYVDMRRKEEKASLKVVGSLSTKIEGVVRTMLQIKTADPEAKVLIFSSWAEVLEVIADGFAQNGITYRVLHSNNKFQQNLSSFKSKQEITALLMPLSSGANGLNLVEARHVMLVEPILNPAAEVQAVGRVHRIGQKKSTTVHRFLIQATIEERMHTILHPKYLESNKDENSLSLADLHQLFQQPGNETNE